MEFLKVGIATARIKGLKEKPHYDKVMCAYYCSILFEDVSCGHFFNLANICVGTTEEEGKKYWKQVNENFDEVYIKDGDKIALIFDEDNSNVIAIHSNEWKDLWIDVGDDFIVKMFKDLNVVIEAVNPYLF
jgi:hypothetical protein